MAGSGDRKGKTRPNFPAFKSTAIKTEKPKAPLKETPVLRAGPSKGSLTASVERHEHRATSCSQTNGRREASAIDTYTESAG
jgi:hypothetical protein